MMGTPAESILKTALERVELLGAISDEPGRLTRTFLSPANREAAATLMGWMLEAGMTVCHDRTGTIQGVLSGSENGPPLLIGSHFDTVIDAGKYDGALGLIVALAAIERLNAEKLVLPVPIHVLGFSDEEGIRFHTTYLGSQGVCGEFDMKTLAATDKSGISLAKCLEIEGWAEGASRIHYDPDSTLGYVEVHIEQGRVLESMGLPASVVTGICGQTRLAITLTGRTDHAGTTPMPLRRDALAGAAECMIELEQTAAANVPLVVTVGKISVEPGASNSVPGEAKFTIDLRHPDDAERARFHAELRDRCFTIAERRGLTLDWHIAQDQDAVLCDEALTARMAGALIAATDTSTRLASGAGHDGVAMSRIAPIAMLFVRSRDGLSHHLDEFSSPEDIAIAIEVLVRFLKSFAIRS